MKDDFESQHRIPTDPAGSVGVRVPRAPRTAAAFRAPLRRLDSAIQPF
jgi:hypothetical protein